MAEEGQSLHRGMIEGCKWVMAGSPHDNLESF